MNILGLTTVENFLINYKNPKCLAITKNGFNEYSIMDVKNLYSFTGINMNPRFYKNNYYDKNIDEFSIPGYEKVVHCKEHNDQYYITTKEPMFAEIVESSLHTFFSIYDIKGYITKRPFFTINMNINITNEIMNLKLIKKSNNGIENTSIYCLPKFNSNETKLLLEIGD